MHFYHYWDSCIYIQVHVCIYILRILVSTRKRKALSFEQSIFSKKHSYTFFGVAMNLYVPKFQGLDARGGRKLQTDTQTGTHGTTAVTLAVHMHTEDY